MMGHHEHHASQVSGITEMETCWLYDSASNCKFCWKVIIPTDSSVALITKHHYLIHFRWNKMCLHQSLHLHHTRQSYNQWNKKPTNPRAMETSWLYISLSDEISDGMLYLPVLLEANPQKTKRLPVPHQPSQHWNKKTEFHGHLIVAPFTEWLKSDYKVSVL